MERSRPASDRTANRAAALGGLSVVVVPDYVPTLGGTIRQATNHALGLAALGADVAVLTRCYERSWPRAEVIDGLPVRRFGPPGRGARSEKLSLLALWMWLFRRRRNLDMVQTIMYSDFGSVAVLAGLGKRVVVIWAALGEATDVIGPAADPLRRAVRAGRRRLLRRCHNVALTPAMQEELAAAGVAARVIPVPVDGRRFRPPTPEERTAARQRLGVGDDDLAVVYTGRFDADKGLDRLCSAFANLVAQGLRGRLLLVGGGEVEAVRGAVRAAGIEDLTTMPGIVADVETYLWAADVFVLPSVREGLSNSLAEAMTCGVPCVAAAEAGGDQVLHGGAGVVPPSPSVEHLTEVLVDLARHPERRAALAEAAIARSVMFAADEIALRYVDLIGGRELRSGGG